MIATLAATVLAAIASLFGIGERAQEHASARTVVWALGDGADGGADGRRLARFVRSRRPDRFFYLGDVYERGTRAEFRTNYHPLYGRLARRTDPVLGNHEFKRRAKGYYPYWARRRGFSRERARHRAYVDETGWQLIAYSSESSPAVEAEWLGGQVAAHPGTCRLAAAHRGRYVVADDEHGAAPNSSRSGTRSPDVRRSTSSATTTSTAGSRRSTACTSRRGRGRALARPADSSRTRSRRWRPACRGGAARAAPRAGGLQAVRRERARLRLGHDRLHARPLSRVSRSTSPAPSRRPRCSCGARRTRAPRRRPARPRGSASSGRDADGVPLRELHARRRRASTGRCR